MYRNNGIIARGLGGGASTAITGGKWSLGPAQIEVIVIPQGGTGGTLPVWPSRKKPTPAQPYDLVIIRTTINGKVDERRFSVSSTHTPAVVNVLTWVNTITTKLNVAFVSITRLFDKIRIRKQ